VGAAINRDVQRFGEDATPNRLDGAATGWTVLGGLVVLEHLAIGGEWTEAGEIADVRTTTLLVGDGSVAITSSFRHRTRVLAALGGFQHSIARVQLAYLLGLSFTDVQRDFSSNASTLVLVTPSTAATGGSAVVNDRFASAIGGVQALVRLGSPLTIVTGVRVQRLRLDPDLSGWSFRTFAGAGWSF
jgi:hypothetical protein